ncbi:hypothetical protein OG883_31105 [Streptomyces sp. NBC_01142]|uniref:hypothetical protein n=1 Tax=Streptomyces sp. NBC_01142 TaxID=2975865 RepID=UPI00225BEA36|nr:hypothetical protein [Streptomyces sp. NBC_01142]MCX4824228.1 hypothetical protein [Streptomyces sp. NBC_01142]
MSSLTGLAIVAGLLASSVPLGLWACRRDPGPLASRRARADADRALLRLAHTGCVRPDQCPTCPALAERANSK